MKKETLSYRCKLSNKNFSYAGINDAQQIALKNVKSFFYRGNTTVLTKCPLCKKTIEENIIISERDWFAIP